MPTCCQVRGKRDDKRELKLSALLGALMIGRFLRDKQLDHFESFPRPNCFRLPVGDDMHCQTPLLIQQVSQSPFSRQKRHVYVIDRATRWPRESLELLLAFIGHCASLIFVSYLRGLACAGVEV